MNLFSDDIWHWVTKYSYKYGQPAPMTPGPDGAYVWEEPGQPTGVLPEALCGICRRDRHEGPLTETVAKMFDACKFDESYDPELDESQVVCPGPGFEGPAVATYPSVWGTITWPTIIYGGGGGYSGYMSSAVDAYWTFDEGLFSPVKNMQDTLDALNKDLMTILGIEPPSLTGLGPVDPVPQAAIEAAAPKAIEMSHKPPVSPGFNFAELDFTPKYLQLTTKKGKK